MPGAPGFARRWGGAALIPHSQKLPSVFSKRHLLGRRQAEDLRFLSLQRKVLDKGGIWLGSAWVGERVSLWFLEASTEKIRVHSVGVSTDTVSLHRWALCPALTRFGGPGTTLRDVPERWTLPRNTRVPGTAPGCPQPAMPQGHDRA